MLLIKILMHSLLHLTEDSLGMNGSLKQQKSMNHLSTRFTAIHQAWLPWSTWAVEPRIFHHHLENDVS